MFGISYWILPLLATAMWWITIVVMFVHWSSGGKPFYPSEQPDQYIPYISDVGAQSMKPLFIAGSIITTVIFDTTFIVERWLRHTGRLVHNTTMFEKACSVVAIIGAIVGAAGLILLSIFDTYRHKKMHDAFLVVFIVGYVVSAIAICTEFQRLGAQYRQYRVLRASFWIKLTFIVICVGLAVGFGVCNIKKRWNPAAIMEWSIAVIFGFYIASFAFDLAPAVHSKKQRFPEMDLESSKLNRHSYNSMESPTGGRHYNAAMQNRF